MLETLEEISRRQSCVGKLLGQMPNRKLKLQRTDVHGDLFIIIFSVVGLSSVLLLVCFVGLFCASRPFRVSARLRYFWLLPSAPGVGTGSGTWQNKKNKRETGYHIGVPCLTSCASTFYGHDAISTVNCVDAISALNCVDAISALNCVIS